MYDKFKTIPWVCCFLSFFFFFNVLVIQKKLTGSGSDSKVAACSVGDPGLIPGLGRSPGEGNGNPLQYSCLKNSMDWGAWWAIVHGVAKSLIRLCNFTLTSLSLSANSVSIVELNNQGKWKQLFFPFLFKVFVEVKFINKFNHKFNHYKWTINCHFKH